MGGTSSSYIKQSEIERLREIARRELKAGEESPHVFLSFAAENLDQVNLLRAQAKDSATDLSFDDWSVRVPFESEDADYIRSQIADRIRRSSATLVLLTAESAASPWVRWEIEESRRQGKKVGGIYTGDRSPSTLPSPFEAEGFPVMPWRHGEIIRFLQEE